MVFSSDSVIWVSRHPRFVHEVGTMLFSRKTSLRGLVEGRAPDKYFVPPEVNVLLPAFSASRLVSLLNISWLHVQR